MPTHFYTFLHVFGWLLFAHTQLSTLLHAQELPHFPKEKFQIDEWQFKEADKLFDAGLYSQAVLLYKKLIENHTASKDDIELLMHLRFHLAQTYFSMEKFRDCIDALAENIIPLSPLITDIDEMRNHSIYLTAMAYKHLGQYDHAEKTFSKYLDNSFTFFDEAHFELGLIYFLTNRYAEAKKEFEIVEANLSKTRLKALSALYFARTLLLEEKFHEALSKLAQIAPSLSLDPLIYELNYLQGEAYFQLSDYNHAIESFEKALHANQPQKFNWYNETLYYLGWSYLKMGDNPHKSKEIQTLYFEKSESYFNQLINNGCKEERVYLALGQCYLSRAKCLKQNSDLNRAEELLSTNLFTSMEAKAHALLLRAEAASTYEVRDLLYQQLTESQLRGSSFFAKGWYKRALNDFEKGQILLDSGEKQASQQFFKRAIPSFKKAFEYLKDSEKSLAGNALKYQALSISYSDDIDANNTAMSVLESLMNDYTIEWQSMDAPDEIFYLHGYFATLNLSADIAEKSLQAAAKYPKGTFVDLALILLGNFQFKLSNFAEAEKVYVQLINDSPSSPLCGEAWLWAAVCADRMQQEPSIGKERRRIAFEKHQDSPFAPEAYFTYYTYQDYLQGDRQAIKHLQSFVTKFPDSPLLIEAYYLIGMDYKRDRKTLEGKWIRKKSPTEAIDAFQQVETTFDVLLEKNALPKDQLEYFVAVRYRAILERAMTNLAIADDSKGAKRQIYIEYAESVFKRLVDEFKTSNHIFTKLLFQQSSYPSIFQESTFGLAQTYIKSLNDQKAKQTLVDMIERYKANNMTHEYYLARAYCELGGIAERNKEYEVALDFLKMAEEAAKGDVLSTDQKLDLWIQQGVCYQGLKQYDNALLILSKVINDDAISTLRLKAMYLRAETYELQARPELARKQFESLAKKGGQWALKARGKLENEYGY